MPVLRTIICRMKATHSHLHMFTIYVQKDIYRQNTVPFFLLSFLIDHRCHFLPPQRPSNHSVIEDK